VSSSSATTGITAAANWTITSQNYRVFNGVCQFSIVAERTTSDVNVPSSGNFGNVTVGTLPEGFRPSFNSPAGGGAVGPIVSAVVASNGGIVATATAPGVTIAVGDSISIVGIFIVA
jgi:hypothetical protein